MGYRVGRVSSRAVSSWSRSPGGCGFRGVVGVGRIFFVVIFRFFFFERTRPTASTRPPCLMYLSTSTGVRTGCHYLVSLFVCVCVCVTFVLFTDCESCTMPVSTNSGSMEAGEYGLTRRTCFFARRLEVVAVAGLMWVSWCVFGGAGFFRVFHEFAFSNSYTQSSQRRAPTHPHQVYRLLCSHLRNMASAVDKCSSSQPNQEANLIFHPTSVASTSFVQASRAPVAIVRETEDSGRRTHEGYRGMCSDPVDHGGEVRGCSVGCTIAMSDVSPFVWGVDLARRSIQGVSRYTNLLVDVGVFWMRRDSFLF